MSMTGAFESAIVSRLSDARRDLAGVEKSKAGLKNKNSYHEEHERYIEVLKNVISVYENSLNSIKNSYGEKIIHGVNCQKVIHIGNGHLHSGDDNKPYDVDGCSYCGRCHHAL